MLVPKTIQLAQARICSILSEHQLEDLQLNRSRYRKLLRDKKKKQTIYPPVSADEELKLKEIDRVFRNYRNAKQKVKRFFENLCTKRELSNDGNNQTRNNDNIPSVLQEIVHETYGNNNNDIEDDIVDIKNIV